MNEQQLQLAFIQFLALKTGAKTLQELETVIQLLGEEGLKLAYAEFMQLMQQQQILAAKFGAKLNYIKKLRGQCPEGYEMQYFKAGGLLCKKCMKKQSMLDNEKIPDNPIDSFKCGRKMKKKENGGDINPNDTISINKKTYDLSGKHPKYPKLTKAKYKNLSNSDKVRVDEKDLIRGRSVNTPKGK